MKHLIQSILTLFFLILLLIAVPVFLSARASVTQSGDYDLDWWTVDGGGASSPSGTGYSLDGTIGQSDAATWQGVSGYTLSGGFWFTGPVIIVNGYEVFLPIVVRDAGP